MAELITLPTHSDTRGSLTVLEKCLPFEIKRVYWMHHLSGEDRGGHRHLKTTQALVCMQGQCEVTIKKNGEEDIYFLNNPTEALLLLPEDWHIFKHLTKDTLLLVMASHPYEAADYVLEPL